MTRKTYCGNLLWQSGLTLLAPAGSMKKAFQEDIPGIDRLVMDYNLYSGPSAKPLAAQGPGRPVDAHSVWADAKFRDPARRDFTLAPDSPAFALGFEPFDIGAAGPRAAGAPRKQGCPPVGK